MSRAYSSPSRRRRLTSAFIAVGLLAGVLLVVGSRCTGAWAQAGQSVADAVINAAAPQLAAWIATRRDALAPRCQPPPPQIVKQLTPYFPPLLLQPVRFCVGWSRETGGAPFLMTGARAMTLDHIIVFRDEAVAIDPVIWAHELTHVEQYERWGISGFSDRYLRNRAEVEAEAWQAAADYKMWALESGRIK